MINERLAMGFWSFIKKSLIFYRRTNLSVVLGVAVSTAVLLGALVIGDSVRYSLRKLVFDRLGQTEFALQTGDRFFRAQLADELAEQLTTKTAPLLHTRGIAIAADGVSRVNKVQVFGIDERFGAIGDVAGTFANLAPNDIVINQRLAKRLNAVTGDEVLLRIEKLDAMPKDAPMATTTEISIAQRFTVAAIASEKQFGRFSLRTSQVEPYNAFLHLSTLSQALDMVGKANVLLVAERPQAHLTSDDLRSALAESFNLADAGLSLKSVLQHTTLECRSDRIFLEPVIARRLESEFPQAQSILTYFVNQLGLGRRTTPYSFVSAANPGKIEVGEDEIVVNKWLSDDLGAQIGDSLQLTFFTIGPMRLLREDTTKLRVKAIVPLSGPYADRDLMPDFPGLSDEENCRDWQAGIPIDYDRIRDKDEAYWDDHRGTPKAFINLKTAQKLWGNRFGDLTAIRFQGVERTDLEQRLTKLLDPESGFIFQPVREQGLRASDQAISFSQLFIGLSFFLIVAALLLTGLLFVFALEERAEETGLLRAIGYQTSHIRRLILSEGLCLALLGSFLGLVLGLLYENIVLFALKTIWRDIVGTSALHLKVNASTLAIGLLAGILMSIVSMWLMTRRHAKRSIADLQKGAIRVDAVSSIKHARSLLLGCASTAAVIVILLAVNPARSGAAAAAFFAAGTLSLVAGVAFSNAAMARLLKTASPRLSIKSIGRRNNARRRLQSLTLIGLLAAGVFITFTVGANRTGLVKNVHERSSGTGGFALWGETALPILYDLNSPAGQDFYGFAGGDASFVQFKVKEGDDASCLNLNRIANPQLLGVQPDELVRRGAFSFAALVDEVDAEQPWHSLNVAYENDVIPGIADQTVIVWGLGKAVGDTLTYVDEKGGEFHIRLVGGLANSIFQGNLLISKDHFIDKYPSVGGDRVLLVDTPPDQIDDVAQKLTWAFQDQGLDVTPTAARLAEFNKVTNTYLSIFMILGGLGLILGSIGLGIVVVRNVLERRGELALMRAVGFQNRSLRRMVLSEHIVLLYAGIAIGALSSLIAVLPSLLTPATELPYATVLLILAAIIGSGVMWIGLAAKMALRGELLPALRNE
ncbi:ABC transporter permease [candidate division KSB1 bacterium]|nr:ABC transporter permease [candidate division KSB1 bacterium]